jgi:asparagine synthase (glutamine-hydrolysing)
MCGIWALITNEDVTNYDINNINKDFKNKKLANRIIDVLNKGNNDSILEDNNIIRDYFSENKFYEYFSKSSNRGPNSSTFKKIHKNIYIGFHRLNIVNDSSSSDQPLKYSDEKRDVYLMCNGEIYNTNFIMNSMLKMENTLPEDIKTKLSNKYDVDEYGILKDKTLSDCEILLDYYVYYKYLYKQYFELEIFNGEYAFIMIDIDKINNEVKVLYGRDKCGIRPLYIYESKSAICLSSDMKSNIGLHYLSNVNGLDIDSKLLNGTISQVGNAQYSFTTKLINESYKRFVSISDKSYVEMKMNNEPFVYNPYMITNMYNVVPVTNNLLNILRSINLAFYNAVSIRLNTNKKVGCLLSGGLDSSLVASIASNILKSRGQQLYTFSIGHDSSEDVKYAAKVADFIGSKHTHIKLSDLFYPNDSQTTGEFFPRSDKIIDEVIYVCETYDVTTIRASIPQYLMCKYISKNTDIKILLIGDGSDELTGGYKYFRNAPNQYKACEETKSLLENIKYFDIKRADSTISFNGLEARVPFLDKDFINLYLSIYSSYRFPTNDFYNYTFDPKKRFNILKESIKSFNDIYNENYTNSSEHYNNKTISNILTKQLLRDSFWYVTTQFLDLPEESKVKFLPDEVLFRSKEAFSDGVSKGNGNQLWYKEVQDAIKDNKFTDFVNLTDEQSDIIEEAYYLNTYNKMFSKVKAIPYKWLPKWCGNVTNPSATVLDTYYEN